MKVSELIKLLQEQDQDSEVVFQASAEMGEDCDFKHYAFVSIFDVRESIDAYIDDNNDPEILAKYNLKPEPHPLLNVPLNSVTSILIDYDDDSDLRHWKKLP